MIFQEVKLTVKLHQQRTKLINFSPNLFLLLPNHHILYLLLPSYLFFSYSSKYPFLHNNCCHHQNKYFCIQITKCKRIKLPIYVLTRSDYVWFQILEKDVQWVLLLEATNPDLACPKNSIR